MSDVFPPGTVVLAKPRGGSRWPGMILGENDVSDDLLKIRPRRRGGSLLAVAQLNDTTAQWVQPADLEELTPDGALENADVPHTRKYLVEAFKVAADPPGYEDVVEALGTDTPAKGGGSELESDQPSKKRKVKGKKAELKSESEFEPETEESASEFVESSSAEDRIEIVTKKRGRSSGKKELATKSDLAKSAELRAALCYQAREKLEPLLLGSEEPLNEETLGKVDTLIQHLEDSPDLEVSFVRQSCLQRVLKAAHNDREDIPAELAGRILALLEKWQTPAEPIIRGIPRALWTEELESKEGTEEPDTTVEPDDQPADHANGYGISDKSEEPLDSNDLTEEKQKSPEKLKEEPETNTESDQGKGQI